MGRDRVRRTESEVRGAGGLRLLRRSWLPADPDRVLLLVHGFGEHSSRYEPLCERAPVVQGAVLSGPLLALAEDLPRLRLARVLSRLAPRLPLGGPVEPAALSRDPEVVRRYRDDPLVCRRMTARLAAELVDAVERTARSPELQIRVPVLLLHGEDDRLCPVVGSRSFGAGLRIPGSRLRTYPRLRHEIFNEPEREQVFQDALEWLAAGPVDPA
jgi:alpha-beta hydrolase superfamily lysophospholipase